jgi:phosphate-selective porin OprO/OprP
MSICNRRLRSAVACVLGAAGGLLAMSAPALAAEPTQAELMQQIEALRAKVEQLEAKQNSTTQRLDTREVDATVNQVLKDADSRSQFLQAQGFTAGYNKGKFLIQSEDGNFVFHPWLQFQPRFVANSRQNAKDNSSSDDFESGFEIRRMKFGFDGNVYGPDLTYQFQWATDRNSGNPVLEEAWVRYVMGKQWVIKGGQVKDPFAHESLVSSKRLLAAERTLLTDNFTGGDNFVQGVSLGWDDGPDGFPIRAEVAYTDGSNGSNQNFQDFPTTKANWGAAARIEWLAFGKWAQYEDFSAMGNEENLLVFGAAADYTEAGDTETLLHTLDAQFEMGRLGLYGAYYGRTVEDLKLGTGATAANHNTYDWGFILQGAYVINDKWEPFLRYDFINFDEAGLAAGTENEVHEITAGVNYYLHGHNAKFTADFTYLPNGSPVADSGADILANNGEAEYLFRAQFQLLL